MFYVNVFLLNDCVVDVKRMSDSLTVNILRQVVLVQSGSKDFCVTKQKETQIFNILFLFKSFISHVNKNLTSESQLYVCV